MKQISPPNQRHFATDSDLSDLFFVFSQSSIKKPGQQMRDRPDIPEGSFGEKWLALASFILQALTSV